MDSEHESKDKSSLSHRWQELPRLKRRLVIATVVAIDAILGLMFQSGIGNGIDAILLGNLPNDMVWLSQSIQLISMGFLLVKVVFDDVQQGWLRTVLMAFSPLFLLFVVLFTIELLMIGLGANRGPFLTFMMARTAPLSSSMLFPAFGVVHHACILILKVKFARLRKPNQSLRRAIRHLTNTSLGWVFCARVQT